jgi:CDP-diacylglycerol--glycerol-3-phosphate 3-phosphatidyltransferase
MIFSERRTLPAANPDIRATYFLQENGGYGYMNLANKITLIRILMIPLFIFFLYMDNPYFSLYAAAIFLVASFTDSLDGYIARRYNMITDFGKFVDPLADKLLVTAAIVALVDFGLIIPWIAVCILAREFIVTALRTLAAASGKIIAASWWGKAKTIVQMIGITILLLQPQFDSFDSTFIILTINYLMGAITIWSGIDYLAKNWYLFSQTK